MLLPSMTSKRIACGPPFHNFTFYSIPQNRADGGEFAQKKPLPLGEVSPKVTERASPLPNSCCTAMSRAFDRAVLSLCLGVSVSSLALSGACAPALPEGEPLACRSGFVWTSKVCMFLKQECPATKVNSCLTMNVCSEAAVLYSRALSFAGYYTSAVRRKWPGLPRAPPLGELSRRRRD